MLCSALAESYERIRQEKDAEYALKLNQKEAEYAVKLNQKEVEIEELKKQLAEMVSQKQ